MKKKGFNGPVDNLKADQTSFGRGKNITTTIP